MPIDAPPANPSASSNRPAVRVLIADDSAAFRSSLALWLARLPGIQVISQVGSGEEALAAAACHDLDLALIDARMPGMGGIEAARRLKVAHPDVRVLVISITSDSAMRSAALAAGADDFIAKTAIAEELGSFVGTVSGPGRLKEREEET